MDADRVIEVDRDRRGEAAGQRTEEAKGDSVRGGEGGGIGVVLGGEPNTLDGRSSLPRWREPHDSRLAPHSIRA